MKKCVSLLLILTLIATLAACALPGTVSAAQPGLAARGLKGLLSSPILAEEIDVGPGDRLYYGYSMQSGGMEIVMTDYPEVFNPKDYYLLLRADGTGILDLGDGDITELTWTDAALISDGDSVPYEMEGDHLVLRFGDESLTFLPAAELEALLGSQSGGQSADPMADVRAFWEGDWYGFWVMNKSSRTGNYADWGEYWWDACVRITVNDDGTGHLVVFDEDGGEFSYLAECDVSFIEGAAWMGQMTSTAGAFWGQDLSNGAWTVDPALTDVAEYDDMIGFDSEFSDEDGTFSYYYVLRRWGRDWEDVAEEGYPGRPYLYEDWYLPLVQAGQGCPFDFVHEIPAAG